MPASWGAVDGRARDTVIRILIAEEMPLLREALAKLLSDEADFEVVAKAVTGAQILPLAVEHRPHVAVIDIELPEMDGVRAAVGLRQRLPECRILILTTVTRPGQLHRALRAKVAGLLPKGVSPAELADAIRSIAAGGHALHPDLALAALQTTESPLTSRETEVLRLLATGAQPVEIAAQVFLSYGTVRNYLTSAATKLGARNRVDAIRIATESGWL